MKIVPVYLSALMAHILISQLRSYFSPPKIQKTQKA
ncbi:Putative protein [Zobellia galactanivorans]|uniref:Uncharacterized protein n=1 Tax=Zobellia galactanivorans (strain DSM 12802 / CCUG 47099 / CIP 106680 / NCIMB 13871 / Dsij) TaxID=63186 RepID=G0LAW8_ZOBGA|nr:Putative protein [Zobellia galactanivorans]